VIIGTDGVPRVLDFGVAKAAGRIQTTKDGHVKGKLSYMAPEQLHGLAVTRRSDIYAVGVMLWELLSGERLFAGDNEGGIVAKIVLGNIERPSAVLARSGVLPPTEQTLRQFESLDETVLRALSMKPEDRFATAREMALEIERKCPPATANECSEWVESIARDVLTSRAVMVAEMESSSSLKSIPPVRAPASSSAAQPLAPSPPIPSSSTVAPLPGPGDTRTRTAVSVPAASPTEPLGAQRGKLVVSLVMLLGCGMLIAAFLSPKRATTQPVVTASPPASPSAEPASTAPSASTARTLTSSSVVAPETPDVVPDKPMAPGKAVPAPQDKARPIPVKVKPIAPPPPKPTTTSNPADDCATPVWYDKDGVKHYKERCVGN
jgi:serine/threonine-protein kinase